jgi:transposase-like protein/IS1 family transposase
MTCHNCLIEMKKFGKYGRKRIQRYRCNKCNRTFSEPQEKPLGKMRIEEETAIQIIHHLVESTGIRATSRIVGADQKTVLRLLALAGERCARLLDAKMRDIRPRQLAVDELWTFCFKKDRRIFPHEDDTEIGSQFIYVSFDRDSKLVINHLVGKRSGENTHRFLMDLSERVRGRFQLTSDGFRGYLPAVEEAFGCSVDYAQLVKYYEGGAEEKEGYIPSKFVRSVPSVINGDPDPRMISTSHVERNNLSMRNFMRRLTRLSLGFSKKLENLKHAAALYFAWYNFCRIHGSLRITPAMAAGLTDHVWEIGEIVAPP